MYGYYAITPRCQMLSHESCIQHILQPDNRRQAVKSLEFYRHVTLHVHPCDSASHAPFTVSIAKTCQYCVLQESDNALTDYSPSSGHTQYNMRGRYRRTT